MRTLGWIFGSRQYCYIYPCMSQGIDVVKQYDTVYDIGGHSVMPLLTTNIKAKKYVLYTSSMFLKNVYDSLRTIKINYDNFMKVAATINVYDNRLAIDLAYEMDIRYNRVKTPCEKENVLYYGILYEYVSRLSYHLFSRAYPLRIRERLMRENNVKVSKLYRKLTPNVISMLWNEIMSLKELMISSGRVVDIIYMQQHSMYKEIFKKELYKGNNCFYSLFPSCVTTDSLEWSIPNQDNRMLTLRQERLQRLYHLCTENNTPFVASTVYRLGMRIYEALDRYIYEDKVKYKMYRASHNKSDIMVFGNRI